MTAENELTKAFREVIQTPNVAFELDRNLFGGQALVRVSLPGATPRAKRVEPLPVIIGDAGESHADMLRRLADALDQYSAVSA